MMARIAFACGLALTLGACASVQQQRSPLSEEQDKIEQAIIQQLKPHWIPPSGAQIERLVTVVRFRLNRDGSLAGDPEVLLQSGITDANRSFAGQHESQAVEAVRLAAPFALPEESYSMWHVVTSNFDSRLAQ